MFCGYCKERIRDPRVRWNDRRTTARFHRRCRPSKPVVLYYFADLPGVLQQQCFRCGEFLPYEAAFWNVQRKVGSGGERRVLTRVCRVCTSSARGVKEGR